LVKVGPPVVPRPAHGPPTVEEWTEAVGTALEAVTLNANDWEDHEGVAAVDGLYGGGSPEEGPTGDFSGREKGRLARSMRVRQLLISARAALEKSHPGEVAALVRHVRAFDHLLRRVSFSLSSLDEPPPLRTILWHTLKAIAAIVLGF